MAASTNLRNIKKIPVYIEEDHNDVLQHIFRNVGAKFLPTSQNVLVHFDSHPDLGLPFNFNHKDTEIVSELFDKLSIESWILPAAYLGIIGKIVWVAPPWSNQIPEGDFRFLIGRHVKSGKIMTSCCESYFLSEGLTCDEEELEDAKEVVLVVCKLGYDQDAEKVDRVLKIAESSSRLILDVDLDFFSTKNPFLDLFPASGLYSRLKSIYTFEAVAQSLPLEEKKRRAVETSSKRNVLIQKLVDLTNYLQENRTADGYSGIGSEFVLSFSEIRNAILESYGSDTDVDWTIVHNAGCTCDDTELPHHVSTSDEILRLMESSRELVQKIGAKISVVTIARSSLDDFCPQEQVEQIQTSVIQMIVDVVGGQDKIDVKAGY